MHQEVDYQEEFEEAQRQQSAFRLDEEERDAVSSEENKSRRQPLIIADKGAGVSSSFLDNDDNERVGVSHSFLDNEDKREE